MIFYTMLFLTGVGLNVCLLISFHDILPHANLILFCCILPIQFLYDIQVCIHRSVPGYGDKSLAGQEPALAQSCLYEYFYNTPGTPTYAFHQRVYGNAPYGDFGEKFRAELYDPEQWADLFARAGARYAYMTMKHGDGFCLFDSSTQPYWNSVVM